MKRKYTKPEIEIWKYHCSNYYNKKTISCYVSNLGRIRDLDGNLVTLGHSGNYYTYNSKGVHRIVAETFIPNPENKKYVDHIDRNTHNNRVDNLRWVTNSENVYNSEHPGGKPHHIVITSKFPYCNQFNLYYGQVFCNVNSLKNYINRSNAIITYKKRNF